ncbi:MAG: hypothetical protein ABSA42_05085 [Terracidiphilus sp.]|jgi:hypothetical protein
MDLIDLFNGDLLELPRSRSEEDYQKFLKDWFDEFLGPIDPLTSGDWVSQELKSNKDVVGALCEGVLAALSSYFNGHPSEAYERFRRAMKAVQPWLSPLASVEDVSSDLQFLYRVRLGSLTDFTRKDLFHIPFEKRTLVRTQRYSISRLPSLYLGGSIWVCWEELGRPSFEKMQISRFMAVTGSNIQVLDLGFRPAVIAAFMATHPLNFAVERPSSKFVLAHAICWPLIAACSVLVKHPGDPFIPEYVIPQLLLQWIQREPGFDGIRYFSTRIAQYVDDPRPAANYVFPVKQSKPAGLCDELSKKFLLTRPLSWQILQSFSFTFPGPIPEVPVWPLKINADVEVPYWKTEFWNCEAKIRSLPCDYVQAT